MQGNDKNRDLTAEEIQARYLPANHFRLAAGIPDGTGVDLVVLPESSLDGDPRERRVPGRRADRPGPAPAHAVFAGGTTPAPKGREYNTTWIYRPEGRLPTTYRKRHLVPFGEFVPWRDALSFIDALDQVPTDYAGGDGGTVFAVPTDGGGRRVGILICFESAFVRAGPQLRP